MDTVQNAIQLFESLQGRMSKVLGKSEQRWTKVVCSESEVSVLLLLLPALCWILSYFQNRLLVIIITFLVVILLIILSEDSSPLEDSVDRQVQRCRLSALLSRGKPSPGA